MNVAPELRDWLRKAADDLAAAYRLMEGDPPFPDQAGFFCQQAAEKHLKAFLIATGQVPPRIHDLDVCLKCAPP
jgi:HEPN domain-containing protein